MSNRFLTEDRIGDMNHSTFVSVLDDFLDEEETQVETEAHNTQQATPLQPVPNSNNNNRVNRTTTTRRVTRQTTTSSSTQRTCSSNTATLIITITNC
jgi:hypothetical protein